MKKIVDPKFQDSVLQQWRGAEANIWMFCITHRRLALRLIRPDEAEVIYVVAVGCGHIRGLFSWKQADVSIVVGPPSTPDEVVYHVIDKTAGFELQCEAALVVRGLTTDIDTTFENFLGDSTADSE